MAVKVILDTDIGTDVDDAWALSLCLGAEEIDLLGVTLVHADLDMRAKIALKMLKLAGRTDVPVYKGLSQPLTQNASLYWGGHEGTDTDFSDTDESVAKDGGVDYILQTIRRYPGEVVVCAIGPETNIGAAISRDPDTMRRVKKLAIMGSTYNGDGPDKAGIEHNIRLDTDAARIVLQSGIPATIVGLNVTARVSVKRNDMPALQVSPYGSYLAAMTSQFCGIINQDFTCMHDPLAVATLINQSVVKTRPMTATEVHPDGSVMFDSTAGGPLDVCTDVDVDKFESLLFEKVNSLVKKGD